MRGGQIPATARPMSRSVADRTEDARILAFGAIVAKHVDAGAGGTVTSGKLRPSECSDVGLVELGAVDGDDAAVDTDAFAGQADHAFDEDARASPS